MDGVLDFIERHKYGITFAVFLHLGVFVGMNFYTVSNPVEMPQRRVKVDIELDDYEVELTPEEMEYLMRNRAPGQDPENLVTDANDNREKSYEDYSDYNPNIKNVEENVKNYEEQMANEIKLAREAKGEKYVTDVNSDVKIYGGDEKKNNIRNGASSRNQYAGETIRKFELDGRGPKDNNNWHIRNPGYRCKGSGKVVVIIKVDRTGVVKEAKMDPSQSFGYSQCMVDNALKYARLSKFNYKESAPILQSGTITYNFIAQK